MMSKNLTSFSSGSVNKVVPSNELVIDRIKRWGGRVDLQDLKRSYSKQHQRKRNGKFSGVIVSEAEELFAMHLDRKKIKYVREYEVEGFHADFMIVGYGILVEIDGWVHFVEDNSSQNTVGSKFSKRKVQHHYDRNNRLVKSGWRVFRLTSSEVHYDPKFAVMQLQVLMDWLDRNEPLIETEIKEKLVEKEVKVEVKKEVIKEVIKEVEKSLEKYPSSLLIKHLLRRVFRR